MTKRLLVQFRYVSWIAIIGSMAGSVLLFLIGAAKTYNAFGVFLLNAEPPSELLHLDRADIAISYLIKSLDTFLVALVLFIFSHGVYTLFIKNKTAEETDSTLSWIKTPNIGHLKNKLAEVIIIILFVKFLELVLINFNQLQWEMLVLPSAIVLLSGGLKLLGLNQHK
ncbi:YqhA family protein [Vibrio barjaei]|jgi:uncharacterized membrane protein YqhA|uniref:YqhA family protein n=1 Tax=Vibrio barjaei TaxID=1676683 RepID=A0ABW7IKG0_9VIBR|nr:YqhA family protein [Vibrio barjaei]MCG9786063.1 YqhA family protein [Vibrio mediterranei]MCY9869380.1 YqhA family protein [Vibrio barjaei]